MIKKIFIILFVVLTTCVAQDELSEIDIFVIDSYVTPDEPHMVKLTFYTSESVTAKIKFTGNEDIVVTSEYLEEHKLELLLSKLSYDSTSIPYTIEVENDKGVKSKSDEFDLYLPEEYSFEIKNNSNFLDLCLGGILYLIPSPTVTNVDYIPTYSLTKELPVISFYNSGYNFPSSYFSIEYSYIFNTIDNSDANKYRNYFRVGYKYILQTKLIKYISPGINLSTNFNGFNGISPEISFGLFKFYETFTLYTRFRYNYNMSDGLADFSEISIGLFTSSISFNF